MGSRNPDGSPRVFSDKKVYHQGSQIQLTSASGTNSVQPTADHSVEYGKFVNASGSLEHVITRAKGYHTSVSSKAVEGSGTSLAPMSTKTESKVFFPL